jgi:hypothetical protein
MAKLNEDWMAVVLGLVALLVLYLLVGKIPW